MSDILDMRPSAEADEIERRRLQITVFSELGKAITSSLDLKEVLQKVMDKTSELLKPKNWSLLLIDEPTGDLVFEIAVGEGADKIRDLRLKPGEGIAGWVAMEKKPLLIPEVRKDPRFSRKADELSKFTTNSIICVPLVVRERCLGVIELINKIEETSFVDDDLLVLTTLADYAAIAIDNANALKKVQELTITDDLTGLYNSRFLINRLGYEIDRARRLKTELSLVFIDLDYFKDVNDRHGHLAGSSLLREAASLIAGRLRSIDMVCRYGGDEFIIVMPDTAKQNALAVAERIRIALREEVFLRDEGLSLRLTGSFGVASYPSDAQDKDGLIHLADHAMYRVKNRKRDAVEGA